MNAEQEEDTDSPPKVAVVFGATGGMGQAIAARLASIGYDLLLVGRDQLKLERLRAELARERTLIICGSMNTDKDIRLLGERVACGCSSITLLVHAAGVFIRASAENTTIEQLREVWTVNALAPFLLTTALMPMLRKGQADVVFINSSIVQRPVKNLSAYSASKNSLQSFADTLRAEFNSSGVRIVSIYPGRTATSMQQEVCAIEGRAYVPELLLQPDNIAELIISLVNLPRTAEVTDIYLRPTVKS